MKTELLAVLIADVSGFTEFGYRAGRTDVAEFIEQQKKWMEPEIRRFGGRLVKWMGDACLGVFRSAADAVLCGRAIQMSYLRSAERGTPLATRGIKVVVHVGDVNVDADGDIYGEAVNLTARLEKAANSDEIYFSEAVHFVLPATELAREPVGAFEFKGVPGAIKVYRTCFGQTPVIRERLALVQTNFVHLVGLADEFGWDRVHPAADALTEMIVETARAHGGTNRGVTQAGCFVTFESAKAALTAVKSWTASYGVSQWSRDPASPRLRTGIHWGTLHVMKYTMMGNDVDVVRSLAPLGFGDDLLLTDNAVDALNAEGVDVTGM